jgi:AMP phosphorylase
MELKIKLLDWSAGLPVAMIDEDTAKLLGVHAKDRVSIETTSGKSKQTSTIVDTVKKFIGKTEIAVSSELKKSLGLKSGQKVRVDLVPISKSLIYIKKKLDKKKLTQKEIDEIIKDIVNNSLSEVEIALFVSAMYENGMNMQEVVYLIRAILRTGNKIDFKSKYVVDKHSIGGIPGNRTTPIVVAICAATGLIVPKTSSRAITSAAGTADVIETIANVEFSAKELKKIVKKTNGCLVWGGSLGMVPADSKIIRIERILKIDPESQLLASIMSKKLAVGSKYILIDIPHGKYAKVNKQQALKLKKKFEYLGRVFHKKLKVVLTEGKEPMGNGVGPALELLDVIKVLDPKEVGPRDLQAKSLFLAGELLEMTRKAKKDQGIKMATQILDSGKAFAKFKEIIKAQGGSFKKIKPAKFRKNITAQKSGVIKEINNKKINFLARMAGCPVDKLAGLYSYISVGERIKKGDNLLTIYSESKSRLKNAVDFYNEQQPIKIKR